jgi:signal transduction histidine kinase
MFKNARIKLTAWYLLIIMVVSLSLSAVIYRIQLMEIQRVEFAFRTRMGQRLDANKGMGQMAFIVSDPEVLEETKDRIVMSLMLVNTGIFVVSGGLGYILAGRTLKPIQEMLDGQNRFISDASHELKTPITSLKSAFEVYLRNPKPTLSKSKTLVKESLSETNKLQTLTESLLQLAQYKKFNGSREFAKVEMKEVVYESVKRIKPKADMAGIKIQKNVNTFSILGNKDSLINLVTIILDNAIKYSKKNSVVLISSTKKIGKGLIIVKDQGIGITEKDLPHIFDRFYRADLSRGKVKADGYGLGLAIAKEIVKEHGGVIKVESKVNEGSAFSIILPIMGNSEKFKLRNRSDKSIAAN